MINLKMIEKGEFIGNTIKIINSTNKSLIGIEGKIIDETKNTFTIKTIKGEKKVLKDQIEFILMSSDIKEKINGKRITKRPEDRIK